MILHLEGVNKSFNGQSALRDVSLTLADGTVALLGANGSGKTTLLRLLATLIRSDSGRITCNGVEYGAQVRALRARTGYMPQALEMPGNLTPRAMLRYLAQIRRAPDPNRADALLSTLGLGSAADAPIGRLSGGQTRLVCAAQALLGQPDLLLMDELFSGLGIEERQRVTRLLLVESRARLTVFSTHSAADAERLAQRIVILNRGRVLYHGRLDTLRQTFSGEALEAIYLRLAAPADG